LIFLIINRIILVGVCCVPTLFRIGIDENILLKDAVTTMARCGDYGSWCDDGWDDDYGDYESGRCGYCGGGDGECRCYCDECGNEVACCFCHDPTEPDCDSAVEAIAVFFTGDKRLSGGSYDPLNDKFREWRQAAHGHSWGDQRRAPPDVPFYAEWRVKGARVLDLDLGNKKHIDFLVATMELLRSGCLPNEIIAMVLDYHVQC
jgi:hypothetical protein